MALQSDLSALYLLRIFLLLVRRDISVEELAGWTEEQRLDMAFHAGKLLAVDCILRQKLAIDQPGILLSDDAGE